MTLASHCSRATTAAALLGQNQAWCCSDSTILTLIPPYCVFAPPDTQSGQRGNLCPMDLVCKCLLRDKTNVHEYLFVLLICFFLFFLPLAMRKICIPTGLDSHPDKTLVFKMQRHSSYILLGDSVPVNIFLFSWAHHQVYIHNDLADTPGTK